MYDVFKENGRDSKKELNALYYEYLDITKTLRRKNNPSINWAIDWEKEAGNHWNSPSNTIFITDTQGGVVWRIISVARFNRENLIN